MMIKMLCRKEVEISKWTEIHPPFKVLKSYIIYNKMKSHILKF